MKTIAGQALMMLNTPTITGTEAEGYSLLAILFLSFGALIIVFQLIPALMLFGSMIKGLFGKPTNATALAGGKTAKTE